MNWLWLAVALGAEPLTLERLRDAVDARIPLIAGAEAKREAAQAKVLTRRGAFDPMLVSEAGAYSGEEARRFADTSLSVLTPLGPEFEIGYRVGMGSFPTYDDRKMAGAGELRAGLELPLLDGLWLGGERGDLRDAMLVAQASELSALAVAVGARAKAEAAWWKWVATGQKQRIARDQLSLAEARAEALQVQVREGSRSELELLDNERVLFERRADVAAAERDLEVSAVQLSLWWRDEGGAPRTPTVEELPPLDVGPLAEVSAAQALNRPDVLALRRQVERAQLAERLTRNGLLPKLDGKVQVRRDLGRAPAELVVGAAFELPLWLRSERGKTAEAVALRTAAEVSLRGAEDRATAELEGARRARDAAEEQRQWRIQALDRAERVRALQARSWELGADDLLTLLLREQKLAETGKKAVDAALELALADLAVRVAVASP